MRIRVYVPATLDRLADWYDAGGLPADLPVVLADDDSEEAEYDAVLTAAAESAVLLGGTGRRVVVVAEVDHRGDSAALVPLRDVAAVHVDVEAVDIDPGDPGGEDLPDLAWFATQEIPVVLGR